MDRNIFLLRNRNGQSCCGWIQEYLVPNFKIKHPANLSVVVLIFLLSFLATSSVFAHHYEGEGYYWEAGSGDNVAFGSTPLEACQAYSAGSTMALYKTDAHTHGTCRSSNYGVITNFAVRLCGDSQASYCQPDTPDCAGSDGTVQTLKTQLTVNYVDGSAVLDTDSIPTDQIQMGQCVYALQDTSQAHQFQVYKHKTDGGVSVWAANEYVFLNSVSEDATDSLPTLTDADHTADYETEQDPLKDTSETVVSPSNSVTEPDGTQVTTEQSVQTDTKGQGVQITETQDTTFISETDGIIKEEVTTTTTYEYTDNSSEVVTETHTSYTQSPITNYTINHNGDTISVTATGGSSASQTTTTTDSFDSSGNLTGSSSQTTGSTDEEVAEEGSFCEENPDNPDCKEYDGPDSDGLYTEGDKTFDSVLADFNTRLNATPAISAINGFFDLNVSGSCQVWSVSAWVFNITFDQLCTTTFTNLLPIIAAVLLATAAFFGFRIAFL